jgi:predicted SnoaL-like aldol condensation-catalyzing enzyme
MSEKIESRNKALVLEAFDTLFNKRDYAAADRFWSPDYIQHSAHIAPGREGLFNLIKSMPPTLKYEPGTIVAEGSLVIVHGRFSGFGAPRNWIAADIVRIKNGILVEHWDVIEDEATEEQSKSKAPMFGTSFPKYRRLFAPTPRRPNWRYFRPRQSGARVNGDSKRFFGDSEVGLLSKTIRARSQKPSATRCH